MGEQYLQDGFISPRAVSNSCHAAIQKNTSVDANN